MKKCVRLLFIMLILAVLCGCGKERPVEVTPEEPPFWLTFDPEQYTLTWEGGAWYLRPILAELDSVYPEEIQANERYNQKLSQCSIAIRQLEQTAAEAAAVDRQNALEQWLVVTEMEAISALNGVGYFVMQQQVEDDIFAEYRVFAPDPQGGCFQLTAHFKMHLGVIDRHFWEILQSFRTEAMAASAGQPPQRPLGEVRSAIAYGDTWQQAYLKILSAPQDYLTDAGYSRSWRIAAGILSPNFYLGVHDFDLDGTPELIIGDGIGLDVFTYEDGKTRKLADLGCSNGIYFGNHAVCAESDGARTRSCAVFGYVDGEYRTRIYQNLPTPSGAQRWEPSIQEDWEQMYPILDGPGHEKYRREYIKRFYRCGELVLETETGEIFIVDEKFDFNGFLWE